MPSRKYIRHSVAGWARSKSLNCPKVADQASVQKPAASRRRRPKNVAVSSRRSKLHLCSRRQSHRRGIGRGKLKTSRHRESSVQWSFGKSHLEFCIHFLFSYYLPLCYHCWYCCCCCCYFNINKIYIYLQTLKWQRLNLV